MRSPGLRLFYVSTLALFLELLLIRYLAVEIKFFMFFKNFVLMASFLGIGLGAGLGPRARNVAGWLHVLTALIIVAAVFSRELGLNSAFIPTGENAFLWYHAKTPRDWGTLLWVFARCLGLTALVAALFVPFGQMLGRLLDALPSDTAYAWDLGGSILGVIAYSGTAFLGWSPKLGIVLVLVAAIPLLETRRLRATAVAITVASGLFLSMKTVPDWQPTEPVADGTRLPEFWWSPYHRVHWEPYTPQRLTDGSLVNPGYFGFLNGHYYFDLLDFRLAAVEPPVTLIRSVGTTDMRTALHHYSVPYALQKDAKSVLLLGAGPGNDAAVALLNGAIDVTAVEIDPAVIRLGKEVHPMQPYLDPRVTVMADDARAFMARCERQFDIVSFGHLDSINLVSSFSSVRTDSYVYTKESMRRAYALVKPGGTLSVSFAGHAWILVKLNALLSDAAQSEPQVFQDNYMGTTTFIVQKPGPGGVHGDGERILAEVSKNFALQRVTSFVPISENLVPTDDWPFLFLRKRTPSPYHVVALLLLIAMAAIGARVVFAQGSTFSVDWSPLWLGVGFMLIETKSITELGLLFGSTWMVTAVGILGVLGMNLLAVWLVRRRRIPVIAMYACLLVAIAVNYVVPLESLLALPFALRLLVAGALVYSPLFFAGAAFAEAFASAQVPSRVFGSNLVGAMIGGTLEYFSVVVGFKTLWLLGAVVYLLAALSNRKLWQPKALTAEH